jgi:signal transduction histidine kinase
MKHPLREFESIPVSVRDRARHLFLQEQHKICAFTDRLFFWLMILQWTGGIFLALVISPKTWDGGVSQTHLHVWAAIGLGGLIALPPIWLAVFQPGEKNTRYVVAVAQMLFSALLIHLTGGRIETHFHVFGSLAFLAFYRDWKVLVPATIVVAADHWIRGIYWPASVYGIVLADSWRWAEHSAWVLFEDTFLVLSCRKSVQEMKNIAEQRARLEASYKMVEETVIDRTAELIKSNHELKTEIDERKRLEVAVVQSEKLAAVGQLAADIANEINTPVSFIYNSLETLERNLKKISERSGAINLDPLFKETEALLKESSAGAERIRKIVWQLRTSAKSDMAEDLTLVNVEDVLEGILDLIGAEIDRKAELKKDYKKTPRLCVNSQKLGQVFINLLLNACQAIEDRGTITIRSYADNGHVCVDVEDSGRGIEAWNLCKIFEGQFRSFTDGPGLGLSVSQSIIKKYGGTLLVKSEFGKGSVFTVKLPA